MKKRYSDEDLQHAAANALQAVVKVYQWADFYNKNPDYVNLLGSEQIADLLVLVQAAHKSSSKITIMVNGGDLNDYVRN